MGFYSEIYLGRALLDSHVFFDEFTGGTPTGQQTSFIDLGIISKTPLALCLKYHQTKIYKF